MKKFFKYFLIIILLIFNVSTKCKCSLSYLKVKDKNIVDENNRIINLKGVNLGGWLLIEGYILGIPNFPEKIIRKKIEEKIGKEKSDIFFEKYRKYFIQEKDIKIIKNLGFNCVRVPFNYKLFEDDKNIFKYKEEGFKYIDKLIKWCNKYDIYIILDLHAAPGSQNPDFHSDSDGNSNLWNKKIYRDRVISLWKKIAERYKKEKTIVGYDLLNEPVTFKFNLLNQLYRDITKAIREVDKNHIIFVEGNFWASDFETIPPPFDKNLVYNFHFYYPWLPVKIKENFSYPDNDCNKNKLEEIIKKYVEFSNKYNVPLICTEFGTWEWNRGGKKWIEDCIDLFNIYNIHWNYWTYKQISYYGFGILYTDEKKVKEINWNIFELDKIRFKKILNIILEAIKTTNCNIRVEWNFLLH
jgi:aryl-phospho-beta-D-glucosidase BglC (GH1 family)